MATSDAPLSVPNVTLAVARGAGNPPIVTDWQLPATNYIAAKRPLQIIQPHPTQIGPDSIYLWAEPGERYEVPICAIFGAYPYHFAVDGPAGMTVGSFLAVDTDGVTLIRPDSYGVVSFDVPATGMTSFSYTVTVTDQQLNTQSVTVNVTVDASKFIHLAPLGQGVGDGSAGNPLGSFRDVWKDNVNDSTYAGKILRIHGGSYTLFGDPVNSNTNVDFDGNLKPKVWVNKHGETPIFDCSQAKIVFNGGNMDDCAFAGIEFKDGRQDVANAHFIWASSGPRRPLFWKNTFRTLGYGTGGTDNPAAIFIANGGSTNPVFLGNEFYGLVAGQGNGVAAWDTYNILEGLFDDNFADDCTSDYLFWFKGQHVFTTIRNNRTGPNFTGKYALELMFSVDGWPIHDDLTNHDNEVCYNQVPNGALYASRLGWSNNADTNYNIWFYRNSLEGQTIALNPDSADWTLEKNIVTEPLPTGTAFTLTDNQQVTTTDLAADGTLSGNAAQYLGTHGSIIAKGAA